MSLRHLPVELIGQIVEYLTLPDLRNVRLVNRRIKDKASGDRFKKYCTTKDVDLCESSLKRFVSSATYSMLDCLENLTITGLLYVNYGLKKVLREKKIPAKQDDPTGRRRDMMGNRIGSAQCNPPRQATKEDLEYAEAQLAWIEHKIESDRHEREQGRDLEALANLFLAIKQNSSQAGLRSLKFDIVVYRDKHTRLAPELGAQFRKVQSTATHILSATLLALKQTNLHVDDLEIFGNVNFCSVQCFDLFQMRDSFSTQSLQNLKALSLSISNRLLPWSDELHTSMAFLERDADDVSRPYRIRGRINPDLRVQDIPIDEQLATLEHPDNFKGVSAMLEHTRHLTRLNLHTYESYDAARDQDVTMRLSRQERGAPIIQNIANLAHLPPLTHLTLRGFAADFDDLYKLIKRLPRLQAIDLRYIMLSQSAATGQSWETIFSHLLGHLPHLSYIYLDLLYGGRSYIACYRPSDKAIQTAEVGYWNDQWPGAGGRNALHLTSRDEVEQGFRWNFVTDYIYGCAQATMCSEEKRRLYGPA